MEMQFGDQPMRRAWDSPLPQESCPSCNYAFTGGLLMDTLLLKYAGSPSALTQEFQQATASLSPKTAVRALVPGEPLVVEAA